jgi:transposase-like protein
MSKRKILTPEQKIAIIREHLLDKVSVADLCDKHEISAVNFYQWQKQLFENGAACFERKKNSHNQRRQDAAADRKIEQLETKLQTKNEVIAELLQEHVQLKKELGEP